MSAVVPDGVSCNRNKVMNGHATQARMLAAHGATAPAPVGRFPSAFRN